MDPNDPGFQAVLHLIQGGGNSALLFIAWIGWRFHKRLERIERKLNLGDENA